MADPTFFDLFKATWAQSGLTEGITELQYKTGWAFIGSVPPSVEQFNKVQQTTDERLAWLYQQLDGLAAVTGRPLTAAGSDALSYAQQNLDATNLKSGTVPVDRLDGVADNLTAGKAKSWAQARSLKADPAADATFPDALVKGDADVTLSIAVRRGSEGKPGILRLASDVEVNTGTNFDLALSPGNLSQRTATFTRTGLIQLASATEVVAGANESKAITPAGLASRTATAARAGIAALATNAEVQAGADAAKIVTPAGLAGLVATASKRGLIQLATDTETAAGTDFSLAVSPGALSARNATDSRTGLIKIASSLLAQGLLDDATAITPKKLADAFKGANWLATSPGFFRLPNGLIVQFGAASGFNSYTISFPFAFPNGPLIAPLAVCIGGDDYDAPGSAWAEASNFPTKTTAKIFVYKPGSAGGAVSAVRAICWLCVGI